MGERDSNLSNQINAYNESAIAGLLLKPFGDVSKIHTYEVITKEYNFRQMLHDEDGNLIQDPETGAFGFVGEPIKEEYVIDLKVQEVPLPIKNFFSLGTTSAFFSYGDKVLARDIIKAGATQYKILTMEINDYVQRGKNDRKIIETIGNINELYFLYGGLVDTSKGYLGLEAQLAKTQVQHSLTDISSSQIMREEKNKRFDIMGAVKNRRNKQQDALGSPTKKMW